MYTIHLVEDNKAFSEEISKFLVNAGYSVIVSDSIRHALESINENDSDLIILDVGLPDGTGFQFCSKLREKYSNPILMLTAFDSEDDIIHGLQCGADDYVTKPCSLRVLLSRIQVLLRRKNWDMSKSPYFMSGEIKVDLVHQSVYINDKNLYLGKTEFDLVSALIQGGGQIMPRGLLLELIWDERERFIEDNTLSVHISRLRTKLGCYKGEAYIETVKGIGYRWNVEVRKG